MEVKVTVKKDNYTVTKIVRKTSTLGRYEVQFFVTGDGVIEKKSNKKAYIVLVLDNSTTMGSKYVDYAVPGAYDFGEIIFSKGLDPKPSLAAYRFNENAYKVRGFKTKNISKEQYVKDRDRRSGSNLDEALSKAKSILKGKNGEKYVVILGDGVYGDKTHSNNKSYIKTMKKWGTVVYALGFGSASKSKYKKILQAYADDGKYFYVKKSEKSFKTQFTKIAKEIANSIQITQIPISGVIEDKLGTNFSLQNGDSSYSESIPKITKEGVYSKKFYIDFNNVMTTNVETIPTNTLGLQIDEDDNDIDIPKYSLIDNISQDGWYPTNNGFKFTVNTGTGTKIISSNVNPEVYFNVQNNKINSCSGSTTLNKQYITRSDYYSITCAEGFLKNNSYYDGYRVDINVNKLNSGINKFDATFGFTSDISITSNLKCVYSFNKSLYDSKHNEISNKLSKSTDKYEQASLTVQLDKLEEIYNNYHEQSDHGLDRYVTNFTDDIKATLFVSQDSERQEIAFENNGNTVWNIECPANEAWNIDGKEIKTCYAFLSKKMQLPRMCLNITSGEGEQCGDSNNQLSGGNKYYPVLFLNSGSLTIKIDNATYDLISSIDLENCSFNLGAQKIFYRQIDIDDPFLIKFDSIDKRTIGRNFSNDKYNFVEMMYSDSEINVWNNKYQYLYQLSKANVENIKDNSPESYLGTDCYIQKDTNKYICSFVRNKSIGENNQSYFHAYDIIDETN